jgi:hypothetical protein
MNLRFPTRFVIFAILTVLDLALPDPVPLVEAPGVRRATQRGGSGRGCALARLMFNKAGLAISAADTT